MAPSTQQPRQKHFFKTLRNATSTSWPNICGAAVWILCFGLLLSCAQFATLLALGIQLLQMGNKVPCRIPNSSPTDPSFLQELPVTYTAYDGISRYANMAEQESILTIVTASIIFPLLPIALALTLICNHFRARGITNVTGAFASFVLMGIAAFVAFGAGAIGPDQRIGQWHTRCYLQPSEARTFFEQRHVRWGLRMASEVLAGVVCLCALIYFALALLAAFKNRAEEGRADIRMDNLHSSDNLPTRSSTDRADGPSPALHNTVGSMPAPLLPKPSVGRGDWVHV